MPTPSPGPGEASLGRYRECRAQKGKERGAWRCQFQGEQKSGRMEIPDSGEKASRSQLWEEAGKGIKITRPEGEYRTVFPSSDST